MRKDGTFIAVEVDDAAAADGELARKLAEACPVDIFAQRDGGGLELLERNLDECVLCRLCLDAAAGWGPDTTVKVIKLYEDGAVLA
jgi:ferredoxin-like protein FixX